MNDYFTREERYTPQLGVDSDADSDMCVIMFCLNLSLLMLSQLLMCSDLLIYRALRVWKCLSTTKEPIGGAVASGVVRENVLTNALARGANCCRAELKDPSGKTIPSLIYTRERTVRAAQECRF
ncbi:hypothetical protein Tco_0247593 [Tanacetum coccineum]